jgi:adenosylcobinamide-GDP ribazoletransferase
VTGFAAAVQFLTRVPIRLRAAPDPSSAVPWFPLVGALIGAAIGAVAAGLMDVVPATVAAAVAVLAGVALTGAFHEDGLADLADSMGGFTPEQRREILRDSRHGSYGVAALCGSIVLRVLAVAALGPLDALTGLVAAHTLGRGAAVGVLALAPVAPVAPEPGLGAGSRRSLTAMGAVVGVTTAIVIAAAVTGWHAAPLVGAAAASAVVVTALAVRALGGVSGDVLGAVEQVAECAVLVTVTALV